jgi:hypothetical protein
MNPMTTLTLLGVFQHLHSLDTFFLDMFFPRVVTFSTKEIAFDKLSEDRDIAALVSPMVAGKVNKKAGGVHSTFEPAYVKPKDVVDPQMLLSRRPGEAIGGTLTPVQRREAVVVELLVKQDKSITRREEWMAVQAVLTGKITADMEGKGTYEVDYQRAAENTIALIGAAQWTALDKATSQQPIVDIENWADIAEGIVNVAVMDKLAWAELRQFKCIKDLLDKNHGQKSVAELGPNVKKEAAWVGNLNGIDLYVYKGKYTEDGTEKNLMPDFTFLLGSSGYDGVRAYGGIQDAKANADGIVAQARYPKNFFTDDPSVEFLMTQSAPLPVTPNPNGFVVATVG